MSYLAHDTNLMRTIVCRVKSKAPNTCPYIHHQSSIIHVYFVIPFGMQYGRITMIKWNGITSKTYDCKPKSAAQLLPMAYLWIISLPVVRAKRSWINSVTTAVMKKNSKRKIKKKYTMTTMMTTTDDDNGTTEAYCFVYFMCHIFANAIVCVWRWSAFGESSNTIYGPNNGKYACRIRFHNNVVCRFSAFYVPQHLRIRQLFRLTLVAIQWFSYNRIIRCYFQ